ncbi:hypothetical protein SmJEL517_g04250 [Synchytrium microbalum]|uniref:Alpha 1,4-glycosyltransferase domain-containing protein n=1 Tax=Synchytrium microbalum TaxID=1806994 RepID=A0A507BT50_9FUNG|nr:uncharacterized protein SmJEL517_g04250 [Synchytrium microbalum]TPX32750.1 hypothetical protein SmJEL517_g04250 [Synchytrium microbalum]
MTQKDLIRGPRSILLVIIVALAWTRFLYCQHCPVITQHQHQPSSTTPHENPNLDSSDVANLLPDIPELPDKNDGSSRILHRSWKNADIPTVMQKWTRTCSSLHTSWTHILWTDAMNRALIATHYSWFLETYDSFERNIMRADSVRVFYLHRYGGVYMDLDFECLRPLDPLLRLKHALLGYLSEDYEYEHNIPNAWMASQPNHEFWLFAARLMMFNRYNPEIDKNSAETMTGPVMLYTAYHKWMARYRNTSDPTHKVEVLPSSLIYPFDWHTPSPAEKFCWARAQSFDQEECKKELDVVGKKSYVMTYWSHSWEKLKP